MFKCTHNSHITGTNTKIVASYNEIDKQRMEKNLLINKMVIFPEYEF